MDTEKQACPIPDESGDDVRKGAAMPEVKAPWVAPAFILLGNDETASKNYSTGEFTTISARGPS